jgi:multidrug efflux pump subunit AcrA (membrane-fusion protein)
MEKNKTVKKAAVFMGTVIIAGGLLFAPSLLAAGNETKKAVSEQRDMPVFSVKTAQADKQTLRAFLEVNGDIVSAQQTEVFPDTSGKLFSVQATLGQRVRKGDVIAEIDPSKPGMMYLPSPVYAPISGTVSKTPLPAGMTVSPGTSITTISVIENLEISARIPEREVAGLAVGLKADVSLQAYPGEVFAATVVYVSPVLDAASRTKLITLGFDKNDRRINAGMFARVRLNTRSYQDVLTVPTESVVHKHGVTAVYVAWSGQTDLHSAELRQVAAGVTIGGLTEIKAGLIAGEAVVVQGQQLLSDGAAVRVLL